MFEFFGFICDFGKIFWKISFRWFGIGTGFFKTLRVLYGQARFHLIINDLRLDQSPTWPIGHVGDWSRDSFTN